MSHEHASDCAMHDAPALSPAVCTCGASDPGRKITQEEIRGWFGEDIPAAVVNLIWNCPAEWTVRQVRAEIRRIGEAARAHRGGRATREDAMTVETVQFLADGNAIIREADGTETLVPAHDAPRELARLMGVPFAAAGIERPSAWRPIEAYPFDDEDGPADVDLWVGGKNPRRVPDCHWHLGDWLHWSHAGDEEGGWLAVEGATHWQPLPPPPERTP